MASHRSLAQSLSSIQRALQNGSNNTNHLKSLLSKATVDLDTVGQYLSCSIEPIYYNEAMPSTSTAAARRTFAIPELLELILDHLPIPSILAFSQTCKAQHTRIQHSKHLQTTLSLRAAPASSHFRAPFEDCRLAAPGGDFYCRAPGERLTYVFTSPENIAEAQLDITAAFFPRGLEQRLPRIGPTYRRMFLTQPPITTLNPSLRCCAGTVKILQREPGITIGDLHDYYQDIVEKHRWCPEGTRSALIVQTGQNRVQLSFTGKVALGAQDPIVLRYERERKKRNEGRERTAAMRERARAYFQAKRAGE